MQNVDHRLGVASHPGRARSGMWERDRVAEAICHILDRAKSAHGDALFIVGEAGLSKSFLLEMARADAGADLRIGESVGDRSESMAPFGLLGAAIDQLQDGEDRSARRGSLPAAERPDGLFSSDRATRFHQAVRWLRQLDCPSVLLLDDLHWADPDSLDLLVFMCRRIATVPLAVISALRPWPPSAEDACMGLVWAGYGSLRRLAPLGDGGARALMAASAGREIPPGVATAAVRQCAGNPLLLDRVGRTIADALDRDTKLTFISDGESRTIVRDRFAGVDHVTFHLLEVSTVFGERFRPPLAAEVAGLGDREAERCFEALWASGLAVDIGEGSAQLTHPLFRQAL